MKYLSKRYLSWSDFEYLREGRKRYIYKKIINHNDNFVETMDYQIPMSIMPGPGEDEILDLLDGELEPRLRDPWFIFTDDGRALPWNYDYDKLSPKLKSYLWQMDALLFERAYRSGRTDDFYDRRIDRLEKVLPEYTDADFERYVIVGEPIPTPEAKKAKDSARRAYKAVNGIIKSNINRFSHFVTLTFAPESNRQRHMDLNRNRKEGEVDLCFEYVNGADFDIAKQAFSQFVKNFTQRKMRSKGYDFQYIAVWELQRNRQYHFHLLTTGIPDQEMYKVPSWLDYDHKEDRYEKGYGLNDWIYGKSDVQLISNRARLTTYVSKYILKSFYVLNDTEYEKYKGQKKYFCSRGLDRPSEDYYESDAAAKKALEEFDLNEISPYEKKYKNPYNDGEIKNNIYTLIDKKMEALNEGSLPVLKA